MVRRAFQAPTSDRTESVNPDIGWEAMGVPCGHAFAPELG